MKLNFQLSIIIPVFNVEAHLPKCLDSVINQYHEAFEIICVNDSSTDGSRKIIGDYQNRFPFIRCIDRPNGGLSAARNTGILEASGEYIVFLDSDDWLEENSLIKIYEKAKEKDVDVLVGNTKWIYSDKNDKIEKQNSAAVLKQVYQGIDAIIELMENEIYVPMAYNYICKREFILKNKLLFREGLIYEDELWTPQVLFKAEKVTAINLYHYNYLQRENTITNSNGSQLKIDSFFYVAKQLISSFDFSNNQILKDLFWFRACVIYYRGLKMQENYKGESKNTFSISWIDLYKVKLSKEFFNACLGNLNYSKNKRRFVRIIYKFLK